MEARVNLLFVRSQFVIEMKQQKIKTAGSRRRKTLPAVLAPRLRRSAKSVTSKFVTSKIATAGAGVESDGVAAPAVVFTALATLRAWKGRLHRGLIPVPSAGGG